MLWFQDMKVVAVPREQYGSFYKGDSYIILSVSWTFFLVFLCVFEQI